MKKEESSRSEIINNLSNISPEKEAEQNASEFGYHKWTSRNKQTRKQRKNNDNYCMYETY